MCFHIANVDKLYNSIEHFVIFLRDNENNNKSFQCICSVGAALVISEFKILQCLYKLFNKKIVNLAKQIPKHQNCIIN